MKHLIDLGCIVLILYNLYGHMSATFNKIDEPEQQILRLKIRD
jgi:hypothetical protein